jgi:hypothetical protein
MRRGVVVTAAVAIAVSIVACAPVAPVPSTAPTVLEGEAAADVAGFARGVPPGVVVEQGGLSYGIAVRPIYPDEVGTIACP